VELNPGFADEGDSGVRIEAAPTAASVVQEAVPVQAAARPAAPAADQPMPPQAGTNVDGIQRAGQIMTSATTARWPMYLRNVKQILRAAGFDERQYGFGGLMDLLKACQRENLIRIERDRRGGLRVFQGTAMRSTAAAGPVAADITTVEAIVTSEPDEPDVIEIEPIAVVDTTAELLGRAKARRPRSVSTRSAAAPAASRAPRAGTRKTAAKKAAPPRRTTRAKKSRAEVPDEPGNS
jgi:hypothetical protein